MSEPSYYDLLRHPKWQEKRLRVMERDGFRCEECFATDKTLNVHHRHYTKGAKPWEYPDGALVCLCEGCHERRHELLDEARRLLGYLSSGQLEQALGYIKAEVLSRSLLPGEPDALPRNAAGEVCLSVAGEDLSQAFGMCDARRLNHVSYAAELARLSEENGGVTRGDLHRLWECRHASQPRPEVERA